MAGHYLAPAPDHDLDSVSINSMSSTPRSDHHHLDDGVHSLQPRVRFMSSFGGKILPRPHDNQLRYVGGDTRIVAVHRHTSFAALLAKLSKLSGTSNLSIKYQLPNEDLDALITVTGDEDVENMMEEYDRAAVSHKPPRLRLFLFPTDISDARASSIITSLLDGSSKRQNWFVDALNGGVAGTPLERGRSEASSIVSEVPDYLFGLDHPDDAPPRQASKIKSKSLANDDVSASDPGSPAPAISSLFNSTSSSLAPTGLQILPDLPSVRTRPETPVQPEYNRESEVLVEQPAPQPTPYSGGPVYHYASQAVQPMPAMYYLQAGNAPVQPLPVQNQFAQSFPALPGQAPVQFPGSVYGAAARPPEFAIGYITDNTNPAMYYATRNMAVVPGTYTSTVVPGAAGEEIPISGSDLVPVRLPHGS